MTFTAGSGWALAHYVRARTSGSGVRRAGDRSPFLAAPAHRDAPAPAEYARATSPAPTTCPCSATMTGRDRPRSTSNGVVRQAVIWDAGGPAPGDLGEKPKALPGPVPRARPNGALRWPPLFWRGGLRSAQPSAWLGRTIDCRFCSLEGATRVYPPLGAGPIRASLALAAAGRNAPAPARTTCC